MNKTPFYDGWVKGAKLALVAGVGAVATLGVISVTYKTVGITAEAHSVVVEYATTHNMSYRDAVSVIVMKYTSIPIFTGYIRPTGYASLPASEKVKVLEAENRNQLEWISNVNR